MNYSYFTRSKSTPFCSNVCFFCGKGHTDYMPLHKVATDKAGSSLKNAVEKANNNTLKVKLSTAINQEDAHAIDIRYHKKCWATHVNHLERNLPMYLMR